MFRVLSKEASLSRARSLATLALVALLASLIPLSASAQDRTAPPIGVEDVGSNYNGGKALPLVGTSQVHAARTVPGRAKVGQKKIWLAIDDQEGIVYPKRYTLRGIGKHIEVWVASDSDDVSSGLAFPGDDCRNDERIKITDRQVKNLISEFDENIYPKESRVFSKPPSRNGENAFLPGALDLPAGYYRGEGDNIVTLIDNVRDDNFYDPNNSQNNSYIAGFFYSLFNEFVDRNVMSIDAFDWVHRTGANPPDEPVPGDPCENASARPFLYEGVFAHEYQHLLEYYEDPDETSWVNEGISNWAQTLTRYVDPRIPYTEIGFDSHVWGFLGYLGIQTPANPVPRELGGPENSLTAWEDQGGDEVLADYGAAYTFMEGLRDQFGRDFMGRFHRVNPNGFDGLARALQKEETTATPEQLLHEWAAMVALDGVLDDGAVLTGGDAETYRVKWLDAIVNWDTAEAFSAPGAPPNGSDYVRLRDASGTFLNAGEITSIEFAGGTQLEPLPVEWVSDDSAAGPDGAALYSGSGPNLDRAIVQQVSVPQDAPTLTFDTAYQTEEFWDFGFVQVSTDNGATWTSLSNATTTSEVDPGAIPAVQENLPGFTGTSGCELGTQTTGECTTDPTWSNQTFDLSAFAGQDILLAFRYVTDGSVDLPGWWIDNVEVGGQTISRGQNLNGWTTPTAINPIEVAGWTVQLVAYDDAHTAAWLAELPLGTDFTGSLSGEALASAIGTDAETVGAIVTYDDPTETVSQNARYTLTVNNAEQPGG